MIVDVKSEVTGSVWKVLKAPGDLVEAGEPIAIVESMKMEIPVCSEEAGVMREILMEEEEAVTEGQVVARLQK